MDGQTQEPRPHVTFCTHFRALRSRASAESIRMKPATRPFIETDRAGPAVIGPWRECGTLWAFPRSSIGYGRGSEPYRRGIRSHHCNGRAQRLSRVLLCCNRAANVEASAGDWQMRNKLDFTKRALVLGGLLIGTATVALAPSAANARNFIGVDVGPLSVGIGANEPDYYYAPAPAPAPQAYVAPPAAYTPPPPVTYQ